MDQKTVQIYALDLYRFLLLRRLQLLEEENIQPTQIGCRPESQFSDVVGKAILTLCHKEQSSYWTWFIRDKDYMLRDCKSFLITAAVYAEFLYNNATSPNKIDALLQFSAVLLEMVTFAFVFGQKDYIYISPIIWEQIFELFFRDQLLSDLSVLGESAGELANVYGNSECETRENGKIKVKEGWLNAIEQSRDIKSLLLGTLCSGRASDLNQSKNVMPEEQNAGSEMKMKESDCKDVNSLGATSDVQMHGSNNESDLVTVASGEKESEFLAVSDNATHVSPLECTDSGIDVFAIKHENSPDAHISRTSDAGKRLDLLESYVRDFQISGSRESFEEFYAVNKYIHKAFKEVINKFPDEVMKFRNFQNDFCRLAKLNSEFTRKANEVRIIVYSSTEETPEKGEQSSSDQGTDANSEQDSEEVEALSPNKVQREDSPEGYKKRSDSGEVKGKDSSNRSPYIPTHLGASSSASALVTPPRPQDIADLETVEGVSLETRDVERCRKQLFYCDYFDDSPEPRSPIKRTFRTFTTLKRRKSTEDSSQQESSDPGGSAPKILCESHSDGQTIMPETELSGSKQSITQPGTTEKLLPTSVSRNDEILGLGASSDVRPRMLPTAHFGDSATISGSGIAQGSAPQIRRSSVEQNPLLTKMLAEKSPEKTTSSAFGGPSLNYDTPSEESTSEESEIEASPVNSPADSPDSPDSPHSPHPGGPSL